MPSSLLHLVSISALSFATLATSACSHDARQTASATDLTSATAASTSETQPVYDVPIDGLPVIGKTSAPVTVVEFADYECPFCQKGEATMKALRAKYGDQVRFAFAVHPLPFHAQARPAALAVLAAEHQGKFAAMHDALIQRALAASGQPLGDAVIESAARDAGLWMTSLAADEEAAKPELARADALAARLGVKGTPSVFVNGKLSVGAQPLATYEQLIDQELAAAHALVASGVRPDDVYNRTIANGAATVAAGEGEGDCAGECDRGDRPKK